MSENRTVDFALRGLQALLALIVIGTDGYAISTFSGHSTVVTTPEGSFTTYVGVPASWGFLIFCAVWTLLLVVFSFVARTAGGIIGYARLAGEVIAVLSWFAGFIAVAVQIGNETCPAGLKACSPLEAAAVMGAIEWLTFMATAFFTYQLVFGGGYRKPMPSAV